MGSILGVAGDVDGAAVAKRMNDLLKGWSGSTPAVTWGNKAARGYAHEEDPANQVHIAWACDAPEEGSPDSWLERTAVAVLSGGMSGRLFTEVREKRGLCYSVQASYGADAKFGRTTAYSGTTPERAQETLEVLTAELKKMFSAGAAVTEGEFQRAIVGMKSRLVMSGESSNARASALARDYHKVGRGRSLEELAAQVDGVTLKKVSEYLARRSLGTTTTVTVGPRALTPPAA